MKRLNGGNILIDLSNFPLNYNLSQVAVLNDETKELKKFIENYGSGDKLVILKIGLITDEGDKVTHIVSAIPSISITSLHFLIYSDYDGKLVTINVTFASDGTMTIDKLN